VKNSENLNKTVEQCEILGIDLGGTIVSKGLIYPDALRVIARLAKERFSDRVYIVSRVSEEQEIRSRKFVLSAEFAEGTGIPIERVHYCRERHEKAPICKQIGVTHFIDDRPEVLAHMEGIVPFRMCFQGRIADAEEFKEKLTTMISVNSWTEIERLLLPPFRKELIEYGNA
jgi:NADH:ubiquinone oxidoreductase subunit